MRTPRIESRPAPRVVAQHCQDDNGRGDSDGEIGLESSMPVLMLNATAISSTAIVATTYQCLAGGPV